MLLPPFSLLRFPPPFSSFSFVLPSVLLLLLPLPPPLFSTAHVLLRRVGARSSCTWASPLLFLRLLPPCSLPPPLHHFFSSSASFALLRFLFPARCSFIFFQLAVPLLPCFLYSLRTPRRPCLCTSTIAPPFFSPSLPLVRLSILSFPAS